MPILAIGISHRHATVELLERLAFTDDDYMKAFRRAEDEDELLEAVVLSTCNRVEAYGSVTSYHGGFQSLREIVCETRGVSADDVAEPLYAHWEDDAVEHLFRVASGLDSMVLGEPQILSQVRDAHRRAEAEGATGSALTALFHAAARTGRRVRTETSVGAAPDAFVDAGAELAEETLGGLTDRRAVVIGAGHMSALAVKHLRNRGVGPLRILNRSLERARALAERADADHDHLDALPEALRHADLVVSATGAAGVVVTEEAVRAAMAERTAPMFLLDLAVPRDIEPTVEAMDDVRLVDIGGLREILTARAVTAAVDIERADAIVGEELHRFAIRRRSERLAPLIHALRDRGDEVVAVELTRFRSELASLTPDERDAVEAVARGVVAKLLHDPIVRLKELSGPGNEGTYAKLLAELYGIDLDRLE